MTSRAHSAEARPARGWPSAITTVSLATAALATVVPIDLVPLEVAGLLMLAFATTRQGWLTPSKLLGSIVIVAFLVRIGVAIAIRGFGLLDPNWYADAMGFEFDAIAQAKVWRSGGLLPEYLLARHRSDSILYRDYLALFTAIGIWPVGWVWLANVILSTAAAALTASAILRFGAHGKRAMILAAVAALAPTAAVFGGMPVRDSAVLLGVGLVLWSVAAAGLPLWIRSGAFAFGVLIAVIVRVQFAACMIVGLGGTVFMRALWASLSVRMRRAPALVVSGLVGALAIIAVVSIALVAVRARLPFAGDIRLSPEFLTLLRRSQAGTLIGGAGSGSSYLVDIAPDTWIAVAGYGILTGVLFLFGPPLGVGAGAGGLIVGAEGILWLVVLLGAARRLWKARDRWGVAVPIAAVILIGVPLFGLTTVDYGSAARLRLQFLPFVLSLASLAARSANEGGAVERSHETHPS